MNKEKKKNKRLYGWLPLFIFLLILAVGLPAAVAEQETLENSVVLILSVKQDYDYSTPWNQMGMSQGSGSGFVIDGKQILTNAHNVSNYRYVEVKKQNVAKRYPAQVTFIAHDCDLALLTLADETFFDDMVPLELGGIPKVNSTVSTCGFPMGGEHVSVTEGVVSRIQMDFYSHSGADSHLVVQTDAAINPGNSGGPVMQDGKVVGVAFQGLAGGDNIGYMIPTTVIRHFLEDIGDGSYDGYGSLGFQFYLGLHSPSYKEYLQVPADQEGIVVIKTMMHSSMEEMFNPGDVITRIDEYDIDNDGKVWIDGLRLHMSEVIERKQLGEKVKLTCYRAGEKLEQEATIALNRPVLDFARRYDAPPPYVVYAGLTFVPLTRNYLETWGQNWIRDIPYYLRYLFVFSSDLNTDRQRKEYVVMSEILPDVVNSYADPFQHLPVKSINGQPVWSMADVHQAVEAAAEGYCTIEFMGDDRPLIIDAGQARARQQEILDKYRVPAPARLENQ